jgi:FkbM family methyltransferase
MVYKKTLSDMIKKHGCVLTVYLIVKLFFLLIHRNIKWLFIRLLNKNEKIIKIFGREIIVNIQDSGIDFLENSLPKQLVLDGTREVEATKIIKNLLKKGDVILEAGANVGYYVLLESKIVKNKGKIYAMEPEPKNYNYLIRNVQLNNLSNIAETFPLAVSDKNEELTLYVSKDSNRHNIIHKKDYSDKKIKVKAVSIDNFLKGKKRISWIRMDVEGAECKLINGMERTLRKTNGLKLFIELHPHITKDSRYSMIKFLKKLKKFGFETYKVISHDSYFQHKLGMTTVESISIDELIKDERITKGLCALEVFFIKNGKK